MQATRRAGKESKEQRRSTGVSVCETIARPPDAPQHTTHAQRVTQFADECLAGAMHASVVRQHTPSTVAMTPATKRQSAHHAYKSKPTQFTR
jgi:hypothetical protein